MKLPSDANASGRDLGREELALLKEVIESGTLNATKGTMVKKLVKEFASLKTYSPLYTHINNLSRVWQGFWGFDRVEICFYVGFIKSYIKDEWEEVLLQMNMWRLRIREVRQWIWKTGL